MNIGKTGVFVFTDAMSAAELAHCARRVEELGYGTLWYPEAFGYESFTVAGFLLAHSTRLFVGSGIANIYARDPMSAVMGHNALNALFGARFVLGLGVSHVPLVSNLRGHEYGKPLAAMRAYLDGMDAFWSAMSSTPAAKQVVLAALGPKMSELAAQRTLGAFPYNITPQQATWSRQIMGPQAALICEQKVCLTTDAVTARKVARAALKGYLGLPNYTQNWFRLGFSPDDLRHGGSDRLMDAMVFWGDAETLKGKLRAYFQQGASQVVIQALRPDGQPGPDWTALEVLASLA
jgi:probable F420-dependent oxidoreductase